LDLIDPGFYKARAEHAELGYTQTQREQVIVRFRLIEPPYENRQITYYGVMTEKTEARVLRGLVLCGWDGTSEDFTGITREVVTLDIEIEPDLHSTMRNRVRWILDPKAALARKPMDDGQRSAFFGRVRVAAEHLRLEIDANTPPSPEGNGDKFGF